MFLCAYPEASGQVVVKKTKTGHYLKMKGYFGIITAAKQN
jgi:hypothetical protein